MNLYLVSRLDKHGYDEYSDMVVVAPDSETAKRMLPDDHIMHTNIKYFDDGSVPRGGWEWTTDPDMIKVTVLGWAFNIDQPTIVCASFHAG